MNISIIDAVAELKSVRMALPNVQRLPDDALIIAYERELGLSFSDDYKFFAKEASDSVFNGKDALRLTMDRNSPRELLTIVAEAREQGFQSRGSPFARITGTTIVFLRMAL